MKNRGLPVTYCTDIYMRIKRVNIGVTQLLPHLHWHFTKHLGTHLKGNNVQEPSGQNCRQNGMWSIWKSRFFSSLQQYRMTNVKLRCEHAWLCYALQHHLALLAWPPNMDSIATADHVFRGNAINAFHFIVKWQLHTSTNIPFVFPDVWSKEGGKKTIRKLLFSIWVY